MAQRARAPGTWRTGPGESSTHRLSDRLEHVVGVRDDVVLHHRRERERRELRAYPLDGRVEPVECLFLDDGGNLGAEAHPRDRLVRDDAAIRLLDRVNERLLVERLAGPRVEDLDG